MSLDKIKSIIITKRLSLNLNLEQVGIEKAISIDEIETDSVDEYMYNFFVLTLQESISVVKF